MRFALVWLSLLFACQSPPPKTTEESGPERIPLVEELEGTAPADLTYSQPAAQYLINTAITPNTATVTGDSPLIFSVFPELPTGLALDETTGAITGTPTLFLATQRFVVTAENAKGRASTTLTLGVDVQPTLSYPSHELTILVPGTPFTFAPEFTATDSGFFSLELHDEAGGVMDYFYFDENLGVFDIVPYYDFSSIAGTTVTATVTMSDLSSLVATWDLTIAFVAPAPAGDPKTHLVAIASDTVSLVSTPSDVTLAVGDTLQIENGHSDLIVTKLLPDAQLSVQDPSNSLFFGINARPSDGLLSFEIEDPQGALATARLNVTVAE